MNWTKRNMIWGVVGLIVALTTACETGGAVPATLTVIPTLNVQVTPSLTPIPPSPTATPTQTVTPTASPTRTPTFTPTVSPKDMLMAAFAKALANLKTYQVEVPQEHRVIAVQLPDRFVQEGMEDGVVQIGATIWMHRPEGGFRMGTGSPPYFQRANLNWYRDQFAQSSQIALLGPGAVDGVACIGYSTNFTMFKIGPPKTPGAVPETTQLAQSVKIWFATVDGFPRRVEMGPPLSLTINFFDFNDKFVIDPPQ